MHTIAKTAGRAWVLMVIALGLFQWMAIVWGLDEMGVHWLLAGPIGFLVAYIPGVGSVCAAYGLVTTLRWSWAAALGLTFGGMFLIAPVYWLALWADARAKNNRQL